MVIHQFEMVRRGRGRGRGRSNNNRNSNGRYYQNDSNNIQSKSNAPRYAPQDCEKCGIWGHNHSECGWIHKRFPSLLIDFASMKQLHSNVNVTLQDENKDKNKNSNDNSNNNKQETKSNSWYNPNN